MSQLFGIKRYLYNRKEGELLRKSDQGMTILEVVFAITILLIGAGFVAQSNAVTFKYRAQSTEYKQMLFYVAGQMDAAIAKQTVSESIYMPFKSYDDFTTTDVTVEDDYLEKVKVEMSIPGGRSIVLYSYRLK